MNSFNSSVSNIKEMLTYFEKKTKIQKSNVRKNKRLTTNKASVDTIIIIETTSTLSYYQLEELIR